MSDPYESWQEEKRSAWLYRVVAECERGTPRDDLRAPSLEMLLRLDDAAFRSLFTGSPVKRTGRERFIRNVLIAAGNSGDMQLVPRIELLLNDASALVRAMAVWALWRLLPEPQFVELRNRHKPTEPDADVRAEWDFA